MIRCCRAWILAGEFFFLPLANKKGVRHSTLGTSAAAEPPAEMDAWKVGYCNGLYSPNETLDQLGPYTSSMWTQPIKDKRTENHEWSIDSNNLAHESHGATENALATMTYATLPVQPQIGLHQPSAALVQIPLEGVTPSIVDPK
jgi:hypothetical protein